MRERLFFKTFLRRKCFFASNVIWYHFGQILKSEVIFYFWMRALSFLDAQLTVWCFFLVIDCINLKNLKAELATIIHSSISGLVSLCYLPTRPLGTVRWGSQKTRFRTIEKVKEVVSTSKHLYWLMLESLVFFYPFFRRIRDQKRLGQP